MTPSGTAIKMVYYLRIWTQKILKSSTKGEKPTKTRQNIDNEGYVTGIKFSVAIRQSKREREHQKSKIRDQIRENSLPEKWYHIAKSPN